MIDSLDINIIEEILQEEKVICCHTCGSLAHSKEEAAASQFVTVKIYTAPDKDQGAALEKSYCLCSNCHLIMKQRLIEGCDIRSFFSNTGAKMEKEVEEQFETDKEKKKTGKQH